MPQQRYVAEPLGPVKAIEIRTKNPRTIGWQGRSKGTRLRLHAPEGREMLSESEQDAPKMNAFFDSRSENEQRGPG
jgi:hypothetical protein